jgi:hypothetical protein
VRFPVSSFRALLVATASMAVALGACGAPSAEDVDPSGGVASIEEPEASGPDDDDQAGAGSDEHLGRGRSSNRGGAVSGGTHAPAPGPGEPFELSPDEMLPNAKQLAADVVQTLLTYEPDDTAAAIAERVAGEDRAPELVVSAARLLHEGAWSRGEIVYPQLGGFTDTSASVMVVARQTVGSADGEVRDETRTLDVRLVIEDDEWVFDDLASAGGRPVERPSDLSDEAAAVVDDDRIELPDTARWDIYRGVIGHDLLALMALMAERSEYGVIVLDTGHPWEVFGTDRQSRHSLGRAVDLYRVGDANVIDDREEGSETHDFMEWLYEQSEMTNMGGPWALDDFGGRSFTDDLHQDHLHIEANRRSQPPAAARDPD